MKKLDKELDVKISDILRKNSLLLFNLKSEAIKFDYQRHICTKLSDIPGKSEKEKIRNSIIVAISLWQCWEIHIRKTEYPFSWYGCVHVEDEWLKKGEFTSPYVIFDSKNDNKIKNSKNFSLVQWSEFPVKYNFNDHAYIKNLILKKGYFEEDNSITWRICVV
jgi:hypothetical protein